MLYLLLFYNHTPLVHLLRYYLLSITGKWVLNAEFIKVLLPELWLPNIAILPEELGIYFNS